MKVLPQLVLATALVACLVPAEAQAHSRSFSYSTWVCHGTGVDVLFRLRVRNVAELYVGPGLESGTIGPAEMRSMRELARQRVVEGIRVTQEGTVCAAEVAPGPARLVGEMLTVAASYRCAAPIGTSGLKVHADLLPALGLVHTHLLRLRVDTEGRWFEAALSHLTPAFELSPEGEATQVAGLRAISTFFETGVVHIAQGYDHLAFLLTLFLLVWLGSRDRRSLMKELLLTATAFTVGHSVTLAFAVTDLIRPHGPTIELLIAVSILVLAFEAFGAVDPASRWVRVGGALAVIALPVAAAVGWARHSVLTLVGLAVFSLAYLEWGRRSERPTALRRAVALIFGLVHGFGFAGVLLEAQLSGPTLALSLLSFNVGVELGQAVVLAALTLALWPVRGQRPRTVMALAGSAATFALACYWIGARAAPG